jgi:hypothetical protein
MVPFWMWRGGGEWNRLKGTWLSGCWYTGV